MNKSVLIGVFVAIIIIFGALFVLNNTVNAPENGTEEEAGEGVEANMPVPGSDTPEMIVEGDEVVVITFDGEAYSPREVTINRGQTVTFTNQSEKRTWPASAVHPTHTVYPGSSIQKCGTADADMIFDACRELQEGESWSFTFTETGEWRYHDHLNASITGSITVN